MRLPRNDSGQLLAAVFTVVLSCAALLTGVPSRASAAALSSAVWTASKTTAGATGAAYTFAVTAQTSSTLNRVTMTVPSGTAGPPAVGTVTPSVIAGGTASLSGTTLTYTFPAPVSVVAGIRLSIQFTGLTNSPAAGAQNSAVTTYDGVSAVDSGTASATFTSTALSSVAWTVSSTALGAANPTYTFTFGPANFLTALALRSVSVTLPPGTSGTPVVASVTPALNSVMTASLTGNTLTMSGSGGLLSLLATVTVTVTGLVNTYLAGSWAPEFVTGNSSGAVLDSGVAAAVIFPAGLIVGAPASLSWSGTLNGQNQAIADTSAADQQLTVDDATNSGAGWHVSVSATNFVNGNGYALPVNGVLDVNGSVSSVWTPAPPTAVCLGTTACTPPNDSAVAYPVVLTSAASSPTPTTVYDAAAGTGLGPITLGGSTAANPVGWWVNVPGYAQAGTYTSTVTVSVISGP